MIGLWPKAILEVDNEGDLPLHQGCRKGNREVVEVLLHREQSQKDIDLIQLARLCLDLKYRCVCVCVCVCVCRYVHVCVTMQYIIHIYCMCVWTQISLIEIITCIYSIPFNQTFNFLCSIQKYIYIQCTYVHVRMYVLYDATYNVYMYIYVHTYT